MISYDNGGPIKHNKTDLTYLINILKRKQREEMLKAMRDEEGVER